MAWKKWLLRISATALLVVILLGVIVLKPALTYASRSNHEHYVIFHNKPIDRQLLFELDQATALLKSSEIYDPQENLEICLNDGSLYPALVQSIQGKAFAYGFYDKVVLKGNTNYRENFTELNGYRWNLTQLLAHEMTHCYQFKKLGFWRSRPVANIPEWKWEGYPEYIARQNADQKSLSKNIDRLILVEKTDNNGWIQFDDSTGTVIQYYKSWLLIKYCIEIKKMSYLQIINDTSSEENITAQMLSWHGNEKK